MPNEHLKEQVATIAVDQPFAATFDEDSMLIQRYLKGDQGAFEHLYSKYHDKVLGIARGILLDGDEAADAVQEIFTLVYRNLHRFDRRSRFGTWLFRIAVNRSIQEARRNRHQRKHVELSEDIVGGNQLDDDAPDPAIQRALAALQPADRAMLTLFYWEDLSLNEIASSLGCGSNAAKTRLYRARERFRSLYEGTL
jgi:RNA polymerase sigma-70 factor (ECF subfamily)